MIRKSDKRFFRNARLWPIWQSCLIQPLYRQVSLHTSISKVKIVHNRLAVASSMPLPTQKQTFFILKSLILLSCRLYFRLHYSHLYNYPHILIGDCKKSQVRWRKNAGAFFSYRMCVLKKGICDRGY